MDALRGPAGSTAVLNAANEEAVAAFLAGTIRFDQIHTVNAATVEAVVRDAGAAARSTACSSSTRGRAPRRRAARERPLRMITTILAFILTLGVLIVIHEYGHYRVAVACGVKVLRFSVGFGRVLWRRQATPDSTEFVVCALPLGGYVQMLDEREGAVAPHELPRAFNRKPLRQRAAIVAAGPVANLLLAVLLYAAAHWIGVDEPKARARRADRRQPGRARRPARRRLGARVLDRRRRVAGPALADRPALGGHAGGAARRALHLMVTDRDGRGQRTVGARLDTLAASEVDAKLMQTHRPRQRVQRTGARRGASGRAGRARPGCAPATACSASTASRSPMRRACAS